MDTSKKRKLEEAEKDVEEEGGEEEEVEENEEEEEEEQQDQGEEEEEVDEREDGVLSADEIRDLIEPFSKEQVVDILIKSALHDPKVVSKIRKLADKDVSHRKLFVRGLGKETRVETLRGIFSQYGDITECLVIKDKQRGKSKGYGFVTFKHADAARRALAEPDKKIDGRTIVSQLASVGPTRPSSQHRRKIYVGNVPHDLSAEKLRSAFSKYGEIQEGPIGFDKATGRSKGYALFIYKSADAAKKALKEPTKMIDGHKVNCKMATSDGGQKARADASDLGLAQSGGIVGAAPNIPYSALSSLLPLNQSILSQHSLLAAQGLLAGLTPNAGFAGLNPSLAHQLALGSSLGTSLDPSLNASLASSLNASLPQGGSQGLSQSSLASYGLHGLGVYGSQIAGLGGSGASSLYGGPTSSMGSQLHGSGQGYTSSQGAGGRPQSLSGYFGS